MYKQKICLGLSKGLDLPFEDQISLLAETGFEEIFIDASSGKENVKMLADIARKEGVGVQSVHAPFNKSDDMWDEGGELADIALNELIHYAELISESEIPIMVTHAFIGFDYDRVPTNAGVERYGKLARRAGELGVKLALENTEGDEFLERLMKDLKCEKALGFCWDSGHEQCYNRSRDLLDLYGDRLICTHLNDNLGIQNFEGKLTWHDDLHLLPFDGIIDWKDAAERLSKCGFDASLTFELKRKSRTERLDNRKYENMKPEEYVAEAYARACRVAMLKLRADNKI